MLVLACHWIHSLLQLLVKILLRSISSSDSSAPLSRSLWSWFGWGRMHSCAPICIQNAVSLRLWNNSAVSTHQQRFWLAERRAAPFSWYCRVRKHNQSGPWPLTNRSPWLEIASPAQSIGYSTIWGPECGVHGVEWVWGISLNLYLCTFLLKPCLSDHPL